jgi:class 3 adenylate cyclase
VINEMSQGLRERDFIKDTFGKYVTQKIRDEILAGKVSLDGELKEVTVLFADPRNFTPRVEKTPPKEVVKIINSYFMEMEQGIQHGDHVQPRHQGENEWRFSPERAPRNPGKGKEHGDSDILPAERKLGIRAVYKFGGSITHLAAPISVIRLFTGLPISVEAVTHS